MNGVCNHEYPAQRIHANRNESILVRVTIVFNRQRIRVEKDRFGVRE